MARRRVVTARGGKLSRNRTRGKAVTGAEKLGKLLRESLPELKVAVENVDNTARVGEKLATRRTCHAISIVH